MNGHRLRWPVRLAVFAVAWVAFACSKDPVPPENRPPVAVGTMADTTLVEGESFTQDVARFFDDPDDDELAYTAVSSNAAVAASVSRTTMTVRAVAEGTARVTVTATDPGGLSATQSFEVTVERLNRAPVVADTISNQTLTEGDTVVLDVSGNFSDPDGDTLTFTAESDDSDVATVVVDGADVAIAGIAPGSAIVSVTATDQGGLSAKETFDVTVERRNRAPEPVDTMPDVELFVDGAFTGTVSRFFSDPDGDPLTYGAESSDTGVVVVEVSGDTLTVTAVVQGTATVTVTATDPEGLSATQTANAEVINRAPEPVDSMPDVELFVDGAFTGTVSRFFSDPDGDPLTYGAESSDTGVVVVEVSGDTLTVTAVVQGTATVTVTATDPEGLSATQTANAEVINRAPEPVDSMPDVELFVEGTFTGTVSRFFSDPDGDPLTYGAESSDTGVATARVSGDTVVVLAVAEGTATITVTATDPGGLWATQAADVTVRKPNRAPEPVDTMPDVELFVDGAFTGTVSRFFSDPDGDPLTYGAESSDTGVVVVEVSGDTLTVTAVVQGTATVTVTATDPDGLSATQTANAEVINRAPEAVGEIPPATMEEEEELARGVSGYFSDPDGDPLAYGAESSDTAVATARVSGDTVVVLAVAEGTATVTVTATDPGGLWATQAADVTVRKPNRAPEPVDSMPDVELFVEGTFTGTVSRYFSDPDGDPLTYGAESSDTGVVVVEVSGDTLTVTAVVQGTATVTVTATDPDGLSATQTANAEVINRAPEAVGEIPPATMEEEEELARDVSGHFSDPDGDPLTYGAESSDTAVATARVSGDTVVVLAVAEGTATITVTATDPGGLSATQAADVTVRKPNRAPRPVGRIPEQGLVRGDTVKVGVSDFFEDPDGDSLTYTASSSADTVASAGADGDTVTIVGTGKGRATVTVTARDPGGLSATQEISVVAGAPRAVGRIPAQALTDGDTAKVDVSDYFEDPDGDELVYSVTSSSRRIARASVSRSIVTIVAVAPGRATVTVTATDPDDLTATQDIGVAVAAPLPVHDLFVVVDDSTEEVDTLTRVVLDMATYFGDADSVFEYDVEIGRDTVAEVESVTGTVVTVAPLEVDSAVLNDTVLFDTTTVSVTATDEDGLSVTQTTLVRVAPADYLVWDGLEITEEGDFVFSGLSLSGCFMLNGFVYGETVYTVHRSEWQVQKGSGWVQVPGTYRELRVCAYDDLPDEAPGTYRLVGEVTTWPADTADTDPGDTVRVLRKSENVIEIEDGRPPRRDLASAAHAAPESGGAEPSRPRFDVVAPGGGAWRLPAPPSRVGCTTSACARRSSGVPPPSARRARYLRL